MKRMLINATQAEERRLAIVDGQKLLDFETEIEGREQRKGNIYKAVITRVEPSLEACFVEYGEDRHGFLPFKEISKNYFREGTDARAARIQDAVREGDNLLIQVEKEERGNKGAALTTFVSLAGRYLVLMPNNPRGGGVSRRIEGEDREELKENLDQLEYPKGMSLIARTAGIGRSAAELQWDLNYMLKLWDAIDGASKAGKGAFLIYQESSLVIRAIRDYFTADIGEILIDTDDIFEQAQQFMNHVMPETANRVKRYRDDAPLFSRFQIEHQIETAFSRTVNLPAGGAIVIDHTEALVSVDVNSARATRGTDIEETATRTNLEAADEIARQMRLRDLGGLIVVDVIAMEESKNRREVEQRLRDGLRFDRARVQFSSISKFGLLELSRQRLRPALSEGNHITCPRCNGTGHIRDTESSALQILRMVQEESMKDNTAAVHVQVPVEVTSFLLNEKRTEITKIELKQRVTVLLVPNKHLETPNYKLERLRHDDPRLEGLQASYTMIEEPSDEVGITRRRSNDERAKPKQEPIIKGVLPDMPAPPAPPPPAPRVAPGAAAPEAAARVAPAPMPAAPAAPEVADGSGFFGWVKRLFGGALAAPAPATAVAASAAAVAPATPATPDKRDGRRGERGERGGRGGERGPRSGRNRDGRESREPRESRDGRDGRPARRDAVPGDAPATTADRDNRAPRPERSDRPEGGRRGPRPERSAAEVAAPSAGLAANAPHDTADIPPDVDALTAPGAATADSERDGARRRRRRGGRDRNDVRSESSAEQVDAGESAELRTDSATDAGSSPTDADARPPREWGEREGGRSRGGRGRGRRDGAEGREPVVTEGELAAETHAAYVEPQPAVAAVAIPAAVAAVGRAVEVVGVVEVVEVETAAPTAATELVRLVKSTSMAPTVAPTVAAMSVPAPAAPASTEPYVLPTDSLMNVAQSVGLEWVNSDADKILAVRAAMAAEPQPARMPRAPKPTVLIEDGPLVLVETKKDLSQLKLPFEQRAG